MVLGVVPRVLGEPLHHPCIRRLECDSGTPYSTEVDLILYTVRLAVRVESAITFYVRHATHTHPSVHRDLRDVSLSADTLTTLQEGPPQPCAPALGLPAPHPPPPPPPWCGGP